MKAGLQMAKYTLSSYEPISMELPKPPVPDDLVTKQIEKLMEPLSQYHEVEEDRPCAPGDYIVVTTEDARIDSSPANHFVLKSSLYHLGAGEMPKTFDDAIIGMKSGETRDVKALIKMPLGKENDMSLLTMTVTVEKLLRCVNPELTDDLVCEHFAPARTVAEFREGVAAQFGLPDMKKDDPKFPDLVLNELAKRLVEEPDPADAAPDMPADALRITCAIDALADHLNLELTEEQVTAQMPGESHEQKVKIHQQLKDQGLADEAVQFARREAALAWLVNKSSVSYV